MSHLTGVKLEVGSPGLYWAWCEDCRTCIGGPFTTSAAASRLCEAHAGRYAEECTDKIDTSSNVDACRCDTEAG